MTVLLDIALAFEEKAREEEIKASRAEGEADHDHHDGRKIAYMDAANTLRAQIEADADGPGSSGKSRQTDPADKSQLSLREKSERALGRAAHPAAIQRLYEIVPDAEVSVVHGEGIDTRSTGRRFSQAPLKTRYTTVTVSTPGGDLVADTAWFYRPVQFDRRQGIKFAFARVLKGICIRNNEALRGAAEKEAVEYLASRTVDMASRTVDIPVEGEGKQ